MDLNTKKEGYFIILKGKEMLDLVNNFIMQTFCVALYQIPFPIKNWTLLEWGALTSSITLNFFRHCIQETVDNHLGSKHGQWLLDIAPLGLIGGVVWKVHHCYKTALVCGGGFALVHKWNDNLKHRSAEINYWEAYLNNEAYKPTDYYERLLEQHINLKRKK